MDFSNCIYDESDSMTFDDVYKKHRGDLPMLVLIMDGHYGLTNEEDLSNFQIVWIHSYTTQKRLLAKRNLPTDERWISIPRSTEYRFKQVNTSNDVGRNPSSLRNILENEGLPVDVEFDCSTIKIGYVDQPASSFQPLTITQEYNENFLHCLEIKSDSLDSLETIERLVATSVNITCTRITGVRGTSAVKFRNLLDKLQTRANSATLDRTAGFQGTTEFLFKFNSSNVVRSIIPQACTSDITEIRWPNSGTGNQLPDDVFPIIHGYAQTRRDGGAEADSEYVDLEGPGVDGGYQTTPPPVPLRRFASEVDDNRSVYDHSTPTYMRPILHSRRQPVPPPVPPAVPARLKSCEETKVDCWNERLKEMTVREVSEVLKQLNLERFVQVFKDDLIDGNILSAITDELLEKDYKFRGIEIIRLRKFIEEGHIPT